MAKKDYINRTKLRKVITQKNILMVDLAEDLDISYMSLWRKLKQGVEFSESEIKILTQKFGEEIIIK